LLFTLTQSGLLMLSHHDPRNFTAPHARPAPPFPPILPTSIPLLFAVKILFLTLTLMVPSVSAAADDVLKDNPDLPWHITADRLNYDDQAEQYIGEGNVTISKEGKKLTADFVRFDLSTMDAFAAGNVIMTVGKDRLTGERMEMNLETETGTVYDGTIFVHKEHFYISGATLQKMGEKSYTADTATVTACKGDHPDWKITGKNVKVTMEGVGVADHATLWAGKLPVLYTPFIAFPMNKKRESGFLFPQIGTGDRKGFEFNQPYFWAIDDHSDATFYAHYMEDRGEKIGLEYRYVWDASSRGAAMVDGFDDDQIDDGTPENSQWGYGDDSALRPNSDRYWFRMKHDQQLPFGLNAKLDLDLVSDQDYLDEFKGGYAGFDATDAYFIKYFGRGLDDYNDAVRLNRLNLNKNWTYYTINAEARWYDDVVSRRQNDTNPILQRLPFVDFNIAKHPFRDSAVYIDLDSGYDHFYREDGERVHRIDAHPRVYLPLTLGHYLSFEPSAGVRGTYWYEAEKASGDTSEDDTHDRTLYDLRADLSSEVYRVFKINGDRVQALRHVLRPRVVWDYIPDEDQSDLPSLDGVDRILKTHRLTYSITNIFTSKSLGQINEKGHEKENAALRSDSSGDEGAEAEYFYRQIGRLKFEQSYDINEANEDNPALRTNPAQKEPFSPLYVELNFTPLEYLSMRGDLTRSFYRSYFNSHNIAVNLKDLRGDKLGFEHRYTHNSSETFYADLQVKITDRLLAYGDYEKNLFDGNEIRTGLGLFYNKGCWSVNANWSKQEDDHQISFMVRLFGLGEFSRTFDMTTFGFPSSTDPVEYH